MSKQGCFDHLHLPLCSQINGHWSYGLRVKWSPFKTSCCAIADLCKRCKRKEVVSWSCGFLAVRKQKALIKLRGSVVAVNFHPALQQVLNSENQFWKTEIPKPHSVNEGENNFCPFSLGVWAVNHSVSCFGAELEWYNSMAGSLWHSLIKLKPSCILRRDPDSSPVMAQRHNHRRELHHFMISAPSKDGLTPSARNRDISAGPTGQSVDFFGWRNQGNRSLLNKSESWRRAQTYRHRSIPIHPAAVDTKSLRARCTMRLSGIFGACGSCCH